MIETNRLKGHVSFPLSDIGPLKLKGRYLNGTAAFQVALRNGVLEVGLDTIEVRGKPLPEALLLQLKRQNLARDFDNNPKAAENIRRFESIEIRDDQVVLKNRVQR